MEKMSWRVWVGGWEGGGDEVQQVLNEGLSSRTERKVVNKNELLGNRSQNLTRDPSSISGKLDTHLAIEHPCYQSHGD